MRATCTAPCTHARPRCACACGGAAEGGDKGFSHQAVWADADKYMEEMEAEQELAAYEEEAKSKAKLAAAEAEAERALMAAAQGSSEAAPDA